MERKDNILYISDVCCIYLIHFQCLIICKLGLITEQKLKMTFIKTEFTIGKMKTKILLVLSVTRKGCMP
jgi:hypothetical protein